MIRSQSLRVRDSSPQLDRTYYLTDDDEDCESEERRLGSSGGFQRVTLRRSETEIWTPRKLKRRVTLQTLLEMSFDRVRVEYPNIMNKLRTGVRPQDWRRRPKWLQIDLQHAIELNRNHHQRDFSNSTVEPIVRKTRSRRSSSHVIKPPRQSDREVSKRIPFCTQPNCVIC